MRSDITRLGRLRALLGARAATIGQGDHAGRDALAAEIALRGLRG